MALIQDKIIDLLTPTINDLGYNLWGVEYINSKIATLRVYINHEDGIDIEDCSIVTRAISTLLDVEDPIDQDYNLEVSSPGFYRPLFTLDQYSLFIGECVTIHLRIPQHNRRKWYGRLLQVTNNGVVLDTTVVKPKTQPNTKPGKSSKVTAKPAVTTKALEYDPEVHFLFTNIMKANLEPEI